VIRIRFGSTFPNRTGRPGQAQLYIHMANRQFFRELGGGRSTVSDLQRGPVGHWARYRMVDGVSLPNRRSDQIGLGSQSGLLGMQRQFPRLKRNHL